MRFVPAILFVCCGAVQPLRADTVVYPTGSFPEDFEAVQAAVDQGGHVLLKAADASGRPTAFDFGPPVVGSGSVHITTDVEIEGEVLNGTQTTIRGGNAPFFGDSA